MWWTPMKLMVLVLLTATGPQDDKRAMRAEVEKLQGTWNIVALETNGVKMPDGVMAGSKVIVKGESFSTVSMGATYQGTLKVDPSRTPKTLDLVFTEGPEKGNTSLGIYELDGDTWKICLSVGAKDRPTEFVTKAGSGYALETLKRGKPADDERRKDVDVLQGEWSMVSGEFGGQAVPEAMRQSWKRVAKGNETTVTFSGQTMLKATFTLDPSKKPRTIDYTLTDGPNKGKMQYGIYELEGDTVRFCFTGPGQERPKDFKTSAGDERTSSVWKRVKP